MRIVIILAFICSCVAADSLDAAAARFDEAGRFYVQSSISYVKESSSGIAPVELGADPKKSEMDKQRAVAALIDARDRFLRSMANYVDGGGESLVPRAAQAGMRWSAVAIEAENRMGAYKRALAEASAAGVVAPSRPAEQPAPAVSSDPPAKKPKGTIKATLPDGTKVEQ